MWKRRIRQILVNLLGNAITFTERGEVVLTAEAVASKGATAGLSAAHVARVAQAFVLEAPRRLAGALEALANAGMLSQAPAGFGGLELALGDAIAEPGTAGTIL